MFSQQHYLIRSKQDGSYLAAQPHPDKSDRYLLLFREQFEALSYLNKYAADIADRFGAESISDEQLKSVLQRWDFSGIGLVKDPLIPEVEFLARNRPNG
jgi:hypothetical protein